MSTNTQNSNLNQRQKEAVETLNGPLLIIAGAGAGKTKTITHRILNLIINGVKPSEILAITFTNKAAKEMRERVFHLIEQDKTLNIPISFNERPFVSTFHALGVHIIKENANLLGITRHFTIYDRGDSKRAVKDALEALGYDTKQYEPGAILNAISREKSDGVNVSSYKNKIKDPFRGVVAQVWEIYENTLLREKSLDFDDLLLKTVNLLKTYPEVKKHYSKVWKYIHIDEYQDTNRVQYEIASLLAEENENICVVGDVDQCLTPNTEIKTITGNKKISEIEKGDKVISLAGHSKTCEATVTDLITKDYNGDLIEIKTDTSEISLTPNHILFSRIPLEYGSYYIYLMYRQDKGFRIGMAKSVRRSKVGIESIGLQVRCNQENADKMWILKICNKKEDAIYWEVYFSSEYGIPGLVFKTGGRKMAISQDSIDKVFKNINTKSRADILFEETGLHFGYPHYIPQGTTNTNSLRNRININLKMFDDARKSLIHPWGMSRVSINTTDKNLKEKLISNGFKPRKGKRGDWRLEITRLDYGEAEEIAKKIQLIDKNLIIIRSIVIDKKKMFFHPASNIIPGMLVGIVKENIVSEQKVTEVTKKHYSGKVYDLNIDKVHNYIANSIPVHNCIYSWRGAEVKNILDFQRNYTNAKIITLEENYRSTQTILAAANNVIKKNVMRPDKNLFTKNVEGEKIELLISYTEQEEARMIADEARKLIKDGCNPREIAILYRANFQSRILEEAFLNKNIPYQVLGVKFFERKEVKDVLSFIKAAMNRDSVNDLVRVVNVPPRGIGKTTIMKVVTGQENTLGPALKNKVSQFLDLLERIKATALKENPSTLIKYIIRESGMESVYKNGNAEEQEKLENLRELVSVASQYDSLPAGEAVEKLLENASLATDQDELEKDNNAVKLMTVHASKGLEFDYVFIAGLEEDLFPHQRMNKEEISQAEAEEERRLFYVAITRARKKVFVSYAQLRTIYGAQKVNTPSTFITDIGDEHMTTTGDIEAPRGIKAIFIDF